mgnify:CR=1 FL=1
MAKVLKRISKTLSTGECIYEGSIEECGNYLAQDKEEFVISFLEVNYNAVAAASECFSIPKVDVTQEMIDSEELKDCLRIRFTDYYMIVD